MTPEEVSQKIARLEKERQDIQMQLNYQVGFIDGQIHILRETLQSEIPDEIKERIAKNGKERANAGAQHQRA